MNKSNVWTVAKLMLGVFLIALITMWTYHESTKNGFVWDSVSYLIHHFWWISHFSVDNFIWMFLSLEVSNWHPLTWLSWAIDYQLYGGLVSSGYHLTSNILHTFNSILVFALMLVVFGLNDQRSRNFPFRTDNHALISACLAALLFAVHPQHVESVAWVAERKDLLCQLFMLLSIFAYVRYVTCDENAKPRWFYGALSLFFMAVLSKPMAVTFPVVLLLIDIYPLRRTDFIQALDHSIKQQSWYELLREKVPFFLLSILLVLITLHAQRGALSAVPFDLRVLNASNSIILYLTKLFLPLHFAPHYPYFVSLGDSLTLKEFVPLLGVLGLTLTSLLAWSKGRYVWLIAWMFYLVTLSPVLGLIQVGQQGAADRYAYFPTLPVYLLAGAGILAALNKTTPAKRLIILLGTLSCIFLLANKTGQQIRVWKDPKSLWSHAVKHNLETVKARHNLGIAYFHQHDYEQAIFNFDRSLMLKTAPHSSLAWRGLSYLYLGRYGEALEDYINARKLIVSAPHLNLDQQCNFFNTGWLYAQAGMMEKSAEFFRKIGRKSKLQPNAEIWLNWLETNNQATDNPPTIGDLPSFCKTIGTMFSEGK
jgi:hypothetical protein